MMPMPTDIPVNAWIIMTKEEADNILLHGGKIIILTEDIPDYLKSPQYGTSSLMANCLLPTYEAVSYFIDNDFQSFSRVYQELLMLPESTIYFATIISAMINDIPLGFVFGTEEIERVASVGFLNFLAFYYGIHLGHNFPFEEEDPNPTGWMKREYVPNNMSLLYMHNLLTPQEFLYVYPLDVRINSQCLNKLTLELRPIVKNPNDFSQFEIYFDNYRADIHKAKKVLVDPLVMI